MQTSCDSSGTTQTHGKQKRLAGRLARCVQQVQQSEDACCPAQRSAHPVDFSEIPVAHERQLSTRQFFYVPPVLPALRRNDQEAKIAPPFFPPWQNRFFTSFMLTPHSPVPPRRQHQKPGPCH